MKHLKSYKNKIEDTSQPQVGYYVILNNLLNHRYNYDITQYITTHIGQVIVKSENNNYLIKFNNVPDIDKDYDFALKNGWMDYKDNILFFSKDKEKVEIYLNSNKYNL